MNIGRNLRNKLLVTTMFVTTLFAGGKAFAQEKKSANNGERYVTEVTKKNELCDTYTTKKIVDVKKAKTPQQLYKERWDKWQKDNNATAAERRAAQQQENDAWAEFKKNNPDKAKTAIKKQVEKSASSKTVETVVGEADVCQDPIVAKGFDLQAAPPEQAKDTLKLFCDDCDKLLKPVDSLQQDIKEKRGWTVRTGFGTETSTNHQPMNSYSALGDKKNDNFFFAEIESPTFAPKGVGSWISGVAGVEIFEKKSVDNGLLVVNDGFEDQYFDYKNSNVNASKDNIYAGFKVGKVINDGFRFTMNPHVFGHVQYFMTKEKHDIMFDGEGVAPQVDKKIPLDLRVGGGIEFAVGLSSQEKVRNGNGLYVIGHVGWQNANILQEERNGLIRNGAEDNNGARINGKSHNGFFQNGDVVVKAGLSYRFGNVKKPVAPKEEPKLNELELLQQQQENQKDVSVPAAEVKEVKRPEVLYDAEGNVYKVDPSVKIEPVKAEEVKPAEEAKPDAQDGSFKIPFQQFRF